MVTLGNNDFQNDTALVSAAVGNGVTGLPNSTFQDDPALTSLVFGNSIGGIGDFSIAFDPALTTVTFGTSITAIGNYAFYQDASLASVTFPSTLTGIGADAFTGTSVDSVEFLGAAPTLITPAGPDASLGSEGALTVSYPWAFDATQVGTGGFTSPTWQGYNTVELATVSFDVKGHGSAVAPERVEVGDTASAPIVASPGLVFNGWYTDSALTTKANFADPITADTTLFASWSALAVTGVPLNPWLLPGATTVLAVGLLFVAFARRRSTHV